ncbi:thioredoxin [Chloroflexota bacterium]
MSKPVSIDDDGFDQTVLKADKPVLVDFWAAWCRPCTMVAPILDELAEEYTGKVNFVKIDVDQNPKTAAKYGIMSLPALIIFKKGEPVSNIIGFRPKEDLKQSLDTTLD